MKKLLIAALIFSSHLHATEALSTLANQAISPDPTVATAAQAQLRAAGPAGLEALTTQFEKQITAHRQLASSSAIQLNLAPSASPGAEQAQDDSWPRLKAALNRVGAQYDNYASTLYWYTDLAQARAASAATGRPILSLRLLGNLDSDLSCANSRLFRTTLYPNVRINQLLRERYILHWESVRPVPVVTIDFGDGRKLTRTITGNSVHYILDSQGRVVDAFPGLYSPAAFASELTQTADAYAAFSRHDPSAYAAYQNSRAETLRRAWAADFRLAGLTVPGDPSATPSTETLDQLSSDKTWQALARLHEKEAELDDLSLQLVKSKFPSATLAAPLAVSKRAVESPLLSALRSLRETAALDTVRNQYDFRPRILTFLAQNPTIHLNALNTWVYTTLFLTPPNDPWLGLAPANAFAALDHDGQTQPGL